LLARHADAEASRVLHEEYAVPAELTAAVGSRWTISLLSRGKVPDLCVRVFACQVTLRPSTTSLLRCRSTRSLPMCTITRSDITVSCAQPCVGVMYACGGVAVPPRVHGMFWGSACWGSCAQSGFSVNGVGPLHIDGMEGLRVEFGPKHQLHGAFTAPRMWAGCQGCVC